MCKNWVKTCWLYQEFKYSILCSRITILQVVQYIYLFIFVLFGLLRIIPNYVIRCCFNAWEEENYMQKADRLCQSITNLVYHNVCCLELSKFLDKKYVIFLYNPAYNFLVDALKINIKRREDVMNYIHSQTFIVQRQCSVKFLGNKKGKKDIIQ